MATLDVLIPHFNDSHGLDLSLASIARQTWGGSLRVIVVDDGSCADELAQAEQVILASPLEIDLIKSAQNEGRPVTRNTLLDAAEAPFLAWLDAGDIWYEGKLQAQFHCIYQMIHAGIDLDSIWVTCNYDWKWEGRRRYKVQQNVGGDQLKDLFVGDKLRAYLWTLLGTRAAFNLTSRFDERLPRLQDLDYFISFVRAGGRIVAPEGTASHCCYLKSDVGRNASEIRACYATIFNKHKASLMGYGPQVTRRVRAKSDFVVARFAANNAAPILAAQYKLNAFINDPKYALYRLKTSLMRG